MLPENLNQIESGEQTNRNRKENRPDFHYKKKFDGTKSQQHIPLLNYQFILLILAPTPTRKAPNAQFRFCLLAKPSSVKRGSRDRHGYHQQNVNCAIHFSALFGKHTFLSRTVACFKQRQNIWLEIITRESPQCLRTTKINENLATFTRSGSAGNVNKPSGG